MGLILTIKLQEVTGNMKRFTVRLSECSTSEGAFDKTVRLLLPEINADGIPTKDKDAVGPAIKKMFGKKHWWQPNSGLGFWYGQVFYPASRNKHVGTSATGHARIDVTEGWK